jgi:hypothetical protein
MPGGENHPESYRKSRSEPLRFGRNLDTMYRVPTKYKLFAAKIGHLLTHS